MKKSPERITVILADDHAVLRAGLRALLDAEPDIEVVGEAGDGSKAVELVRELHPAIAILDIDGWATTTDFPTEEPCRSCVDPSHFALSRYVKSRPSVFPDRPARRVPSGTECC